MIGYWIAEEHKANYINCQRGKIETYEIWSEKYAKYKKFSERARRAGTKDSRQRRKRARQAQGTQRDEQRKRQKSRERHTHESSIQNWDTDIRTAEEHNSYRYRQRGKIETCTQSKKKGSREKGQPARRKGEDKRGKDTKGTNRRERKASKAKWTAEKAA